MSWCYPHLLFPGLNYSIYSPLSVKKKYLPWALCYTTNPKQQIHGAMIGQIEFELCSVKILVRFEILAETDESRRRMPPTQTTLMPDSHDRRNSSLVTSAVWIGHEDVASSGRLRIEIPAVFVVVDVAIASRGAKSIVWCRAAFVVGIVAHLSG